MLHAPEEGDPGVSRTFAAHRSEMQGTIIDTEIVTKTGAVKEVEIKAGVLGLNGSRIVQAFFRDITEERRSQREQEKTLELLQLLNRQSATYRAWSGT